MAKSVILRGFILFLASALIIVSAFQTNIAYAKLSTEQKRLFSENSLFVDIKQSNQCGGTTDTTSGSATSSIYVLGDSYSVGMKDDLDKSLKDSGFSGVTINASTGSSISDRQSALDTDAEVIKKAQVIVIELGTNADDFKTSIPAMIKKVKNLNSSAKIYWVNVYFPRKEGNDKKNIKNANEFISQYADEGYTVLDWHALAKGHSDDWFGSDNLHPNSTGYENLIKMIVDETSGASTGSGSTTNTSSSDATPTSSTDYKGRAVFNTAQLAMIEENKAVYQKAAQEVDIPWQMIAVIHLRETGLKRANPSNGQGAYQFYDKHGGPYPTGPIDEAEFARQTKLAAEFIKGKAASNYSPNKSLTASASAAAIKDTFFGYNGRAGVYENQAKALGYNPDTEGYEGSPYVMNIADADRDPHVNKTTWGQVKRDGGPIEYPANDDYGAYVMYGALAGVSSGGTCGSASLGGPVRDKVVALAKQEFQLWDSKKLKPGEDYKKYTGGSSGNWCAWFASWIYNQAGYPLKEGNNGSVGRVSEIRSIGEANGNFTFHPVGDYTPVPGDIVVQQWGDNGHVNLVISVSGTKITVIGGNQSNGGGDYTTSKVSQYEMSINDSLNVGFVSPKE